jgi:hypothetical protein
LKTYPNFKGVDEQLLGYAPEVGTHFPARVKSKEQAGQKQKNGGQKNGNRRSFIAIFLSAIFLFSMACIACEPGFEICPDIRSRSRFALNARGMYKSDCSIPSEVDFKQRIT